MGIVITSGFLVIITNIDKFFFNSFFGINTDLLYYIGTFILIPFFGIVYIYRQRIIVIDKSLIIREKVLSNLFKIINVDSIIQILFYEEHHKKKTRDGIMILSHEESISILFRVFSKNTIAKLLSCLLEKNSQIEVDEYIKNIIASYEK